MAGVNVISHDDGANIVNELKRVVDAIENGRDATHVIYGFNVKGSVADPASKITYLADAVGHDKASMDFDTGEFSYGSWESAFFMPKPCMLSYDGIVEYYLDPEDYSKKADGTASDIADSSYEGNAMMEFPRIWWKVVPKDSGASANIYIANYQAEDDYHCWCNYDQNGAITDHFYMSIYQGCLVNGKMRSISGMTYDKYVKNTTAAQEISYAQSNGDGWYITQFSEFLLIEFLTMLIFKSTNIQAVLGRGNVDNSWDESYTLPTGGLNDKGLFWGESTGKYDASPAGVKLFGMENYYGNKWKRLAGLINDNGNVKYKLTWTTLDGTTVTGFNLDGTGYISTGITPSGTSGGYITTMQFSSDGAMVPSVASGSDTTYYCDGLWFNNSQVDYAQFGGTLNRGSLVGSGSLRLTHAATIANGDIGASLSFK